MQQQQKVRKDTDRQNTKINENKHYNHWKLESLRAIIYCLALAQLVECKTLEHINPGSNSGLTEFLSSTAKISRHDFLITIW